MVVTTPWSPTYAKSSWTPKVNPFLYASPLPTLLNGMLLHTPSHMHDRFTPTSTEAREEARDIKPDKTEAWKRRQKNPRLNHRSLLPTPESPVLLHRSLRTAPSNRPRTVRTPLRRQHRRQTGVSGLDRSLQTPHRSFRPTRWACTPPAGPSAHVPF